jgi:16S rRNA (guanine527-N7)-methyltransferase
MFPDFKSMRDMFSEYDLTLTETAYRQFVIYKDFLIAYNTKVNLTAITDPADIAVKHFLDSCIPLSYIDITPGQTLADIGTGAGFPGVPMAILHPELSLTLIESNGKRVVFLAELMEKLSAVSPINAEIVQSRSEDCARGEHGANGVRTVLRAHFDIVTARAVAALPALAEYCMPFLKIGGVFLVPKGSSEVFETGAAAVEELGGELSDFQEYALPGGDVRRLFIIEKTGVTPKKYPRANTLIKKNPLK